MARYVIDPKQSRVTISASSTLHPIDSETDGLVGWVDVDLEDDGRLVEGSTPRAHLELPVDRLRSGNGLEDRELRRRIQARKYPTISGELTELSSTGDDHRYRARGEVTFRGVTRPSQDDLVVSVEDRDTIRIRGTSQFDIRDFEMDPPRILMLRVRPEVTVSIDVTAHLDPDPASEPTPT